MTVTKYYCDKCNKEIINCNDFNNFTVKWDDKYFDHSTKILLCKDCAMDFHKNVLHCERED